METERRAGGGDPGNGLPPLRKERARMGQPISFWSEAILSLLPSILGWREERFRSCADTRPFGRSDRSRARQIRYLERAAWFFPCRRERQSVRGDWRR